MFTLHLNFEDGSNPWVRFRMTAKELGEELVRWSKNYCLVYDTVRSEPQISCMIYMTAIERSKMNGGNVQG